LEAGVEPEHRATHVFLPQRNQKKNNKKKNRRQITQPAINAQIVHTAARQKKRDPFYSTEQAALLSI